MASSSTLDLSLGLTAYIDFLFTAKNCWRVEKFAFDNYFLRIITFHFFRCIRY